MSAVHVGFLVVGRRGDYVFENALEFSKVIACCRVNNDCFVASGTLNFAYTETKPLQTPSGLGCAQVYVQVVSLGVGHFSWLLAWITTGLANQPAVRRADDPSNLCP